MMHLRARNGYVFLVTVLMIGAIASTTLLSLLLLGWAAEQNGALVERSQHAFELMQICAERSLRSLRLDPTYAGNETFTFARGTCKVYDIGGSGNLDRTLCIESVSGPVTRRVEIQVNRIFPLTTIRSWQEVTAFTRCT
ncbi:hypothetical protein K8942_00175 [Candidatus Peribacteria bacterium]|nr:MAG: hypothetical protein K8942_00175 [Candidatus Peribacteria bacterium]